MWNGRSGLDAADPEQGLLPPRPTAMHADARHRALADATVLDFGCGWGRLTRFFARDVEPGDLLGCDPVEEILEVCRSSRVPAELARSEFVPERLPFDGRDRPRLLVLGLHPHLRGRRRRPACGRSTPRSSRRRPPRLTIRPPAYLDFDAKMHAPATRSAPTRRRCGAPLRLRPHPTDGHPQYEGGEMTYGEAVISLPYVRERWASSSTRRRPRFPRTSTRWPSP